MAKTIKLATIGLAIAAALLISTSSIMAAEAGGTSPDAPIEEYGRFCEPASHLLGINEIGVYEHWHDGLSCMPTNSTVLSPYPVREQVCARETFPFSVWYSFMLPHSTEESAIAITHSGADCIRIFSAIGGEAKRLNWAEDTGKITEFEVRKEFAFGYDLEPVTRALPQGRYYIQVASLDANGSYGVRVCYTTATCSILVPPDPDPAPAPPPPPPPPVPPTVLPDQGVDILTIAFIAAGALVCFVLIVFFWKVQERRAKRVPSSADGEVVYIKRYETQALYAPGTRHGDIGQAENPADDLYIQDDPYIQISISEWRMMNIRRAATDLPRIKAFSDPSGTVEISDSEEEQGKPNSGGQKHHTPHKAEQ